LDGTAKPEAMNSDRDEVRPRGRAFRVHASEAGDGI
jgi:hypothetical protein